MIIIICSSLKLFICHVHTHNIIMCRFVPSYYYGRGNLVSEHKRPPAYKEQQSNGKKKNTTERINALRLHAWGLGYYSAITRPISQSRCLVHYYPSRINNTTAQGESFNVRHIGLFLKVHLSTYIDIFQTALRQFYTF